MGAKLIHSLTGGPTRPPPKAAAEALVSSVQSLSHRHADTHTHVDTQTHRHADTQTQTPRRTYTHADKHTDRHAHKHTDTHKQYGHAVVVTRFPFITKTGLYFRSFLEVPKY